METKTIQPLAPSATALAATESRQLSPAEIAKRMDDIKSIMASAMIEGIHYGRVEGCGDKPVLLKPGAEMLAMTFRISPEISHRITDLGNGHREYIVVCTLRHIGSGTVWANGIGSCSTMEKKYRYRNEWVNRVKTRTENKDIADVYNTCLKMAKKRAQVDATLTALSCSHLFTQDLEDYKEDFCEPKSSPPPPQAREAEVIPPEPPAAAAKPDFSVNLGGNPPPAPKPAEGLTEGETAALCEWLRTLPDKSRMMAAVQKYCPPAKVGTLSRAQAKKLTGELACIFGVTYSPGFLQEGF